MTEAYVTLATNDRYAIGALVLAHSLRTAKTTREVCILITPSVSEDIKTELNRVFNNVVIVDVLNSNDSAHLALLKRPELGVTFTKLHCWTLTQYIKCVFLDADMLAIQNADELFSQPELSAACDIGWPDCFNSGLFVFSPSQDTYNRLLQFAETTGSFDGGDQGLLNTFFTNWNRLSFVYNMVASVTYTYLPAYKQFGKDVKFVHFLGETKPWQQKFNNQSGTVVTQPGHEHFSSHLTTWWRTYVASVHLMLPHSVTSTPDEDSSYVPEYQHSLDNHHTSQFTHDTRNTYHTNYFESQVITTHQVMPSQCYSQPCLEANYQDKATHASFECSFCDQEVPIKVHSFSSNEDAHLREQHEAQQQTPASPTHDSITVSETINLSCQSAQNLDSNILKESEHKDIVILFSSSPPKSSSLDPEIAYSPSPCKPQQSISPLSVTDEPIATISYQPVPVNSVNVRSTEDHSCMLTSKITSSTLSPSLPSPRQTVPELRHPIRTKSELGVAGRRGYVHPSRFGTPFQPFQPLVCTRIRSPFSGQRTARADPAQGPSLELSEQLTTINLNAEDVVESKKRWEKGTPDYLGQDAFENILAHIDAKLEEN